MQLGYTIPLQKFLNIKTIPYGAPTDLRFCWELHILKPNGRPSLFSVHASSRYAILFYGLSAAHWSDIPQLLQRELACILREEGFSATQVERYFTLAGQPEVTKTHGRRPVAFLNRAVDDLYALPVGIEEDRLEQQPVRLLLNDRICRAAGHPGQGTSREFLHTDLMALTEPYGSQLQKI